MSELEQNLSEPTPEDDANLDGDPNVESNEEITPMVDDDLPEETGLDIGLEEEVMAQEAGITRSKVMIGVLITSVLLLVGASFLFYSYLNEPAPLPELVAPQAGINYAPHYLFSIYGVEQPVGIALSPEGDRIYVTESGGDRQVWIYDREGEALGSFAPPETGPGERSPVYAATDSQGRVFVTDRLQHAVYVFDSNGNYIDTLIAPDLSLSEYVDQHLGTLVQGTSFVHSIFRENVSIKNADGSTLEIPAPGGKNWSPLGIRIGSENRVFITDVPEGENRVREFALPMEIPLVSWHSVNEEMVEYGASGQGNGEFLFPNAAQPDSQGRVYVSDGNNGRISVWAGAGDFLFNFGGGTGDGALSLPRGIFVDHQDRLFVTDAVGQNVKVYDVSGSEPVFLHEFGGIGMGDGQFNYPNDIFVDRTGRIYIVDRENSRVQVWSY